MSELPHGWEWAVLDDLAASTDRPITDGPFGSNLKTSHYTDEGPRVIRLQNVGDGEFVDEKAHISQEHYETLRNHAVEPRDLVVASLGSDLPRACLVPDYLGPAIVKADCIRVRLHSEIDARFVNFALQRPSLRKATQEEIHGVGRPRIGMKGVRALLVPVPPLPEQRRIVAAIEEHFSRLDAAEASTASAGLRLEALRRSATENLLSSSSWAWTTLGEIAEVKGGVTKDAKRERDDDLVEVPFLRVANVQRGYLDLGEVKTVRVAPARADALELRDGDILFNEGGDRDKLGRGWVWENQINRCIHQNHVFRARLMTDRFDPKFVSTHGNTWGKRWFEKNGKQTTNLASLNLTTLKRFPIPAAPIEEQRSIVNQLGRLDEEIERTRTALSVMQAKTTALRRSVLAAAFSGRLVPQDPSDEPASALLERIASERSAATPSRKKKAAT